MTEIIFKQPLKTTREQILFPFRIFLFFARPISERWGVVDAVVEIITFEFQTQDQTNFYVLRYTTNLNWNLCKFLFRFLLNVFFYLVFYFSGWGGGCKTTKFWCVLAQVVVGWLVGWSLGRLAFGGLDHLFD